MAARGAGCPQCRGGGGAGASLTVAGRWRGLSAGLMLAALEEGRLRGPQLVSGPRRWREEERGEEEEEGAVAEASRSGRVLGGGTAFLFPSRATPTTPQVGKREPRSAHLARCGRPHPPGETVRGGGESPPANAAEKEAEAATATAACCYYRGYHRRFLTSGSYAACLCDIMT